MDAIIGRYRVHTEQTSIVLQHPTGISFGLEPEEALALADLINIYKETLTTLRPSKDPVLTAIPKRHDPAHSIRR